MQHSVKPADAGAQPRARRAVVIRKLQKDDIYHALVAGLNDFRTAPRYGLVVGGLHTLFGWVAIYFAEFSGLRYFAYPLLTGVALVSPFSAAVLYEVSRRLETGAPLSWGAVLRSVRMSGGRDLGWMCLVSLFGFIIWIDYSFVLYLMFYGLDMPDPAQFIHHALTTPKGIVFVLVGNLFGGMIAFAVFAVTVVSYPLLLDRDVDFVTAMISSVKAVLTNPWPLLAWALVIALFLAFGLLSALLGLTLVLPLLGHASWHVYRKLVEPESPAAA
ncbi:DUF2189 domain-containing protein [Rhodoblastus acidophilus]|uniref:DUF2189 domain-containing protein n=1 Tax=Candidatus Rhodoblastus alkanivorans TaxID=2954117 RepID=A0ABS9Z6C1_9HYPH|nr:DUF2189 domain-containing protein [Candidatus Rhodoblastus alkanivorans]MCI4680418.1 DUF2189 domain-containing protein [Candidatus Rhodoblastus alkanivorans]MCI4683219.1 DUF2189 domain-containing protein [Candidatus Rhodoblastus alkanivorans]MDI4640531.1 DUF2189 domain-containing protein [Rhodoblastus acidophilus]